MLYHLLQVISSESGSCSCRSTILKLRKKPKLHIGSALIRLLQASSWVFMLMPKILYLNLINCIHILVKLSDATLCRFILWLIIFSCSKIRSLVHHMIIFMRYECFSFLTEFIDKRMRCLKRINWKLLCRTLLLSIWKHTIWPDRP